MAQYRAFQSEAHSHPDVPYMTQMFIASFKQASRETTERVPSRLLYLEVTKMTKTLAAKSFIPVKAEETQVLADKLLIKNWHEETCTLQEALL